MPDDARPEQRRLDHLCRDKGGQRFSPLTQITPDNVPGLKPV
jgi:glucose dehydrogenase